MDFWLWPCLFVSWYLSAILNSDFGFYIYLHSKVSGVRFHGYFYRAVQRLLGQPVLQFRESIFQFIAPVVHHCSSCCVVCFGWTAFFLKYIHMLNIRVICFLIFFFWLWKMSQVWCTLAACCVESLIIIMYGHCVRWRSLCRKLVWTLNVIGTPTNTNGWLLLSRYYLKSTTLPNFLLSHRMEVMECEGDEPQKWSQVNHHPKPPRNDESFRI